MDRYRGEGRMRDDYSEIVRMVIDAVIVYLAMHLRRVWPRRLDPLAGLAKWSVRLRDAVTVT